MVANAMAVLEHVTSGRKIELRERALIGRSPRANVRLQSGGSSHEHASIGWDGAQWTLKDLASSNGTHVNDEPVLARQRPLSIGDILVFGDPLESWRWINDEPPLPTAIRADGVRLQMVDGLLSLPDETAPRASLYARDAHWELDVNGAVHHVQDGEVVEVAGVQFRLELPNADPASDSTRTLAPRLSKLAAARVSFQVSQDEERVTVALQLAGATHTLPPRSFHYMLLTLARARLRDQRDGVSPNDAGWLPTDELSRGLLTSNEKLNVDVHRARRLVAKLGLFVDPDALIERRPDSAELRLGVADLAVHSSVASEASA